MEFWECSWEYHLRRRSITTTSLVETKECIFPINPKLTQFSPPSLPHLPSSFRPMKMRRRKQDSTLAFEKRRNVPIPYDRDLVQATMAGMKRISEIKAKREKAFYKARYVLFPFLLRSLSFVRSFVRSSRERGRGKKERWRVRTDGVMG